MTSLTQDRVTGKRLTVIVPIYFVILFSVFTTTLLYWMYQSSNTFLAEELKKNLSQRQVNAENSLDHILENLELTVKYIAAGLSLEDAVAAMDHALARKILRRNLNSGMKSHLDILFVKDLDNRILVDDSSPFFDLQDVLPVIAANGIVNEIPSQLFTFPAEQSELVIIGKSFPLIYKNTGRVVGTLFGGIVLNDNISLVDTMRKNNHSESLMLLQKGRITASTQHAATPVIMEAISHLPVASDDYRRLDDGSVAHYQKLQIHTKPSSLELVFIVQDNIFADLKASYRNKFILFLLLVIGFSSLTFYLVKRMIVAPLSKLSLYATTIAQGSQAVYQEGPLVECNQIGIIMAETVQGLQQTTEQLRDEMAKRQEITDLLSVHRNSLEQIIEMRTRELIEANENLTARNVELTRAKTEHQQAQEENQQLAEAVKNSPVSIVITDNQGLIEYVNPKFIELTQYDSDDVIGENPRILTAGLHSKKYFKDMWETILSGQHWYGEFCNRKMNGEKFWEQASISPIFDKAGKIRHFVAVKEDITSRKCTETNLQEARQQAEEASKQKSQFLANMSHEIRTPMNALIGLSELAMETSLTDKQHDYLSKIHSSAQGLLIVLNDILDYSKIEAGKLELEETLFSLVEIIDQVESLFVDQAIQQRLELRLLIEDAVPYFLYGDATRLRQVLINLVGNGLKFTGQGTVTVCVSLLEKTGDRVQLKFTVVDSGIGIPEDKLKKLFIAFNQIDPTHTRKYGGTGLGLAISKELIEMMGGRLEVASERGAGSTFSFVLDLKSGGDEDIFLHDAQEIQKKDKLIAMQQIDGAHILLVEDNAINRQVATEILSKANLDVEIAINGAEAVAEYRSALRENTPFTAILMDIQMPILDGYEATAQIRENEKQQGGLSTPVPVIAITAHTMAGDHKKCLAAGMNDFISKPVNSRELFITLAKWIVSKETEQKEMVEISDSTAEQKKSAKTQLPDNLPGFDVQEGVSRLEGNTELYLRLLKQFREEQSGIAREIKENLHKNELEDARGLVHTIKGVAANLGAAALAQAALDLEEVLDEEKDAAAFLDLFTDSFDEFLVSITELLSGESEQSKHNATTSRVDYQRIAPLLEELTSMLRENNFNATVKWSELRPLFQGKESEIVGKIDDAISRLEFDQTIKLLAEVKEKCSCSDLN